MGCCSSKDKLLYDEVKPNQDNTMSSYTVDFQTNEWTLLSQSDLQDLLNRIHLCPFEEGRFEILMSLQTRLISCNDLNQILQLIQNPKEKFKILQMLNGNLADKIENWKVLLPIFINTPYERNASSILNPHRRSSVQMS